MINRRNGCVAAALWMLCTVSWSAEPTTWTESEALAASASADLAVLRSGLVAHLRQAPGPEAVQALRSLSIDPALNAPSRERLLFETIHELRAAPPGAIDVAALEYLKQYRSEVLVPHHDHPDQAVALYDIHSAAHGLENQWRRVSARDEATDWIARDPARLVETYASGGSFPERRGYLDAIDSAPAEGLREILELSLAGLESHPALLGLAGRAALAAHDVDSLALLARIGRGPDLNEMLRLADTRLALEEKRQLVESAVSGPHAENAALAIAHLGPDLAHEPSQRELLVAQLGDVQLGASVALTLSRYPSAPLRKSLNEIAADAASPLAAARAKLSLQLMAELAGTELPR